ncbi:MAG: DUF2723 domain-containing protein [Flammeovirgaceae bacterium]|nr:DUF2723 domain-containing protein [Flammeovirgaceae bacterium]
MKEFKKINDITGWALFLISFFVYLLTVEETASFWDCGEFIAVSYKLEVPHPPGAPLFLLLGRMFSFLAFGDVTQVAYWINILSVLSSALTILFLHWSIVLLGRKVIKPIKGDYSMNQIFTLMGGGIVGSLAYTFSDSFWFSAVEAEVYALSSLFTAFVFWAILKWEWIENQQFADKWMILIAYVMGLSIGVHLLNLVAIPALGLIFYFKKYKETSTIGVISAFLVSGFAILVIMYGVIPGLPSVAGWFEILFVNSFGLPFGYGITFFIIIFIGMLVYGLYYSEKNQKEVLNVALLAFTFILIGYTSYGIIPIRSGYNTPINENDPSDIISVVKYLKREQYGDRPLVYGQSFVSTREKQEQGAPVYRKAENKYEIYDYKTKIIYDKKNNMLFPRIYSQQPGHPELYRQKLGLKQDEKPTMLDNLSYMISYQFGHMYFRYFMWNFAGRESDEKEAGWLSPWEDIGVDLPEELARNKARSNFYMLPFILGIIGLIFQYKKDEKDFWVLMILFFLTGLGLVLYLNSPPVEPRERDYIYVGSFYAFAIWIGFGVFALKEFLSKYFKNGLAAPALACALSLSVPAVMGINGWDNHNRSNRFHSIDQAKNTLRSCAPNAILFTGGDNDTFPLWYVQEVEGFRTDVRVVVLSYFSTDWYISQMRRQAYESDPLPMSIKPKNYLTGTNDYVPLVEAEGGEKRAVNVASYISLVDKNDPRVKVKLQGGGETAKLLTRNFSLDIDKADILEKGFIPKGKEDQIVDQMVWSLKEGQRAIFKSDLAILDLLATNNWERPIYFNNTSSNTSNLELRPFLQLEGMAFRLMPIRSKPSGEVGEVNIEVMKENLSEFEFRGFDDPSTYNDEEYRKFGANTRHSYARLAKALYDEGRLEEAKEVLDTGLKNIPDTTIPYSYFTSRFVELYYLLGEKERAKEIADVMERRAQEFVNYAVDHGKYDDNIYRSAMIFPSALADIYRRLSIQVMNEATTLQGSSDINLESDISTQLEEIEEERKYYMTEFERFDKQLEENQQKLRSGKR